MSIRTNIEQEFVQMYDYALLQKQQPIKQNQMKATIQRNHGKIQIRINMAII